MVLLGILCVAGSFAVGIQTAGDVQPIGSIAAESPDLPGDVDDDGRIGIRDAVLILEVARGYRDASPAMLQHDPNGDGILTVDDAISVLKELSAS